MNKVVACEVCGRPTVVDSVWRKRRSPIVCGHCRRISDGASVGEELALAEIRRIKTRVRALDKQRPKPPG